MKKLSLLFGLLTGTVGLQAQDCVSIQSIFVDACTLGSGCDNGGAPACNCEGKNEMMRFRIGNETQNVNDLSINWPNNTFQGICQNVQTSQNTEDLNATIEACGWLVEPIGGVLPANSEVLIVTSADMCITSNSFANLSDTLIIIFQCPGNFYGHFANHGTGFRSTTVSFGIGCSDSQTYNRSLLVDQNGNNFAQDGATVDFPSAGAPIYYNEGCNAPVPVEVVDAGDDQTVCSSENVELEGTLQGEFNNWYWTGGTGIFDNPNSLNTIYTPGAGDTEGFVLTLNAENCNGIVSDAMTVSIQADEIPEIVPEGPLSICAGETIELTAIASGTIVWSTDETGTSIIVSEPGTYSAYVEGSCSETETIVEITESAAPSLSVLPDEMVFICEGESVELSASGDGIIEWYNGSSDETITVSEAGNYSVSLTNDCGMAEVIVTVEVQEPPEVSLTTADELLLCEGDEVSLGAEGTGAFEWNTGATTSDIVVNNSGIYTVTLTNDCGIDQASVQVLDGGTLPQPEIMVVGNSVICAGESTVLVVDSDSDFEWDNGSMAEEREVFLPGTYSLSATNDCGTVSVSVTIESASEAHLEFNQADTLAICNAAHVAVSATSTLPISWSTGETGSSITLNETGAYFAFVQSSCGSDTVFFEVVAGHPEAGFIASADTGSAPLNVVFSNTSTDASDYQWFIGSEEVSTETDLNHTFFNSGEYVVELVATDSVGCRDTLQLSVSVFGCLPTLFIPNTFTPNEDGVNDLFRYTSRCIEEFEMRIFNRWGTLLYTGQKGSPFWNGNNGHGSYVSDGVYIYNIRYTDANGLTEERDGTITIFR